VSEQQPKKTDHRTRPTSEAFKTFMASGWAPRGGGSPPRAEVAPYARARRAAVSAAFPGERVVVPAGGLKVRSNDCDYAFRPHSAFAYLTGLGADREPDAVLVLEPRDGGHDAVLYYRPPGERDTEEFYADARYGELWVGARPTLADLEAELDLLARHVDELADAVAKDVGATAVRVLRDADPDVAALVDAARVQAEKADAEGERSRDDELAVALSELRLTKDEWEVAQMRLACAATAEGFAAIVRSLPEAVAKGRGERWVQGQFAQVAGHAGNGVGYDSIAAAGEHACTLHWIRNDGDVRPGELLLVDAGVELDSLYTADVTRTMPIDGRFTDDQRRVYQAVLDAQEAGLAAVRPGNTFRDVHAAAIRVVAERLVEWGMLPEGVDVETTLGDEGGHHRRWMVHGTSHHLGIDVHDCAQARREAYLDGELRPGMVLTVEPGLYFKSDDELVPASLRGIGVRIEDDVLVTEDGHENLSAALPRTPDDVEAWMATLLR
jgi:Xaa-Pro aminopeptidase